MTYRLDTRWLWVRRGGARALAHAMRMAGLALLAVSWSAGAAAQNEARVLLMAPAEAELTARILGQTRDLGVTLEVADGAAPQSSELAALAGRARAAAIVVWTQPRRGTGL